MIEAFYNTDHFNAFPHFLKSLHIYADYRAAQVQRTAVIRTLIAIRQAAAVVAAV